MMSNTICAPVDFGAVAMKALDKVCRNGFRERQGREPTEAELFAVKRDVVGLWCDKVALKGGMC